jgi:transposase
MARKRPAVSHADFVRAFPAAKSAAHMGEMFSRTAGWAEGRRRFLVKHGVTLPKFPRPPRTLAVVDAPRLNALLAAAAQQAVPRGAANPARVEEFIRVWNESAGPAEVAAKLGITEHSARTLAGKYRGRGRDVKRFSHRWTADWDRRLVETWAAARSRRDATESLGLEHTTVMSRVAGLRQQGVVFKYLPCSAADADRIDRFIAAYESSNTLDEVARTYGSTRNACKSWATQLKKRGYKLKPLLKGAAAVKSRREAREAA